MNLSSQQWSDRGKQAFLRKDMAEAEECYTKAIELEPTRSVFFSNRARVNITNGNLEAALKDAQRSIELNESNIKGHLLNGQVMALMCKKDFSMLNQLDTCIERLTKALTLCAGQNMQKNEQYLKDNIRRVKKLKWLIQHQQEKQKNQQIINHILNEIQNQQNESEEAKKKQTALIRETLQDEEELKIPEYYLCSLSKKIMSDPVTTKFANTYERKELEQYFKQAQAYRDPINQQLLQNPTTDVLPNINLKKAIEEFIELNPWAFEFSEHQSIEDMNF